MGIASLDTATPTSSTLASTGAADIRALRVAIRETFVNFGIGTDVVTATAAQINGSPNKAGAETISGAWNFTSGTTMNGISNAVGTEAIPAYSFSSDPDTGIYSESANVVNVATSGSKRLSVTAMELRSFQPVWSPPGSQTVPAFTFTGDTTTGIYQNGGASIGFTVGGTERGYFTPGGILQLVNGIALNGTASADLAAATVVNIPTVTPSTDSSTKAASTAFVRNQWHTASLHKDPHTLAGTASEVGATWTVNPNAPAVGTDVTATSDGRLTANANGVYRVDLSCSVYLAASSSSFIGLRKNGSALTGSALETVSNPAVNAILTPFSSSVLVSLNSGQYVSLYAHASAGSGTLYNAQFLMQRIA